MNQHSERMARPGGMSKDEVEFVEIPIDRARELRTAENIVQDIRDHVRAEAVASAAHHEHVWSVAGISHPAGVLVTHPRTANAAFTLVLLRCASCGYLIVLHLEGGWTDQQIKGVIDGDN